MILKEFPVKNQQLYLGTYNSECKSGGVFVCVRTHMCALETDVARERRNYLFFTFKSVSFW